MKKAGIKVITVAWFFVMLLLYSCSPKTSKVTLPLEQPTSFSNTGTFELPDRWWTVFQDSALNTLVDTALRYNFNLLTVWKRLDAAQAVIDRESAAFLPTFETSFNGGLSRFQSEFEQSQQFRLGASSSYEVDLWGRIKSIVDAQRYRAQATLTDYQAAAITLSAQITRTWYQLMEARAQAELVDQQVQTNEQILTLLERRISTEQVRGVDILRQRQLIESTRTQKVLAESRAEVLEHQLALLLGRPPQSSFTYAIDSLPDLPPLPQTGIPTDLVRRRPDVQSAFLQLQAADRDLATAISSRYPRLSLNISASTQATDIGELFSGWARSFGGNIFAPIFLGGELNAEVDRTEAVKEQRLYEYGQTVLTAFQEVEDALIQEEKQQENIQLIREQLDLAQQTYEQLQLQYLNGVGTYLDALTTLTQQQQLQRELLSARLTLLEFRIGLYRALAGAFSTKRELDE